MTTTTITGPAIAVTGVRKHYGRVRAIDRVDLRLAPGEVVALLGPNGAGKSTLVDMLLGLTTPDQGEIQMPGADGLTVAAALHRELPSCRILVCTTFGRPGYLARAMAAGAAGFVVKDAPPEQLVEAIRRVHAGLRVVDPALAAESLATGHNPLTDRERDVLRLARHGGTVAEIARALRLSQGTVRNHLSAAIGKTGAATRAGAARTAEDHGWL
jgi:two-component system response regulator DesR